ncbi:hypothetical protein C8R26_11112 [Nitrosomonas oligotropha]|uniref:Outer membrane murein-binding lipoprotein Lpp n=1 Tax=Nitrosomonas oligotropha TaxID=42354 RepID=A0A2T5HZG4_9PROT|nr:hypothetical protein [Nitrosomonas oligotropha]PTQ76964.1 hypothetical protein C8R26_11112 [Nitrosomonas oligotropha]
MSATTITLFHFAKQSHRIHKLFLWSMIFVPLLISGCSIGDKIDKLTDKVSDVAGDTVATLDNAIDALDRNSASWQAVLQDTTAKLTSDAQSTVRNEVSDVLNRSVAATGDELRCNVDFIGTRVRQALVRIRARLMHQAIPPVEPALCHVVPAAVDMALDPSRRNKLEFFGYDFDTTPIKVTLHDTSRTLDVSPELDRLTHYHMTLNLGANGVPLSKTSDRLTLEWQNHSISSIAVIQPATPVCREKTETYARDTYLSFTPPHTRGDKEFGGHGPEVWAKATWSIQGTRVNLRLWMKAQETRSDWTTAEGERNDTYYTPPPGWRIDSIVSTLESSAHYIDTDHNDDRQGGGPNGPVKEFKFRGDRDGDDAGSYTGVDVTFNPLVVKLVEVANCAPASAVKSLQVKDQLAPSTIKRLQPMMLKLQPAKP